MHDLTYDIYQLRLGKQFHKIRFMSSEYLKKHNIPVHPDHYDKIYSGKFNVSDNILQEPSYTKHLLEKIYEEFRLFPPSDYMGHSLLVSDIVVIHEHDQSQAFMCERFGFTQTPEFLHPEKESPLLTAPSKESTEDKNYLRNAEMYFEENYNDIDGRMSTQNKLTPKDDTLPQPELFDDSKDSIPASTQKESVREKLKHANENIISSADQKITAPAKKHQLDR